MCLCCKPLLKAIDAYLAKADDDLAEELEAEGYTHPKETARFISSLEDRFAEVLQEETSYFLRHVGKSLDIEQFASEIWPGVKLNDDLREKVAEIFKEQFQTFLPEYANYYLEQTDKDLRLASVSRRTASWVDTWGDALGSLMQLNSHTEMDDLLKKGFIDGDGIAEFTQRIMESGIRDERYKARRAALTETLRAHSVAQQEGMMQSPSVDRKKWRHTGSYRNAPRKNHVRMDGQVVPKDEPYKLIGAKGGTYLCMYPRDPSLPAEESINCHCISQPVVNDDILGMSLEERQRLQREAVDQMDNSWEAELDARNKAKAGIDEETVNVDWIKGKSREDQIKYFGGGNAGKQRLALLDSGVISNDADLERLYKTTSNGKRRRKTLQELADDGIMTISGKTVNHSVTGDFTQAGRHRGGCHSQAGLAEFDRRGVDYEINRTFSNGVRVGNIPKSKDKFRRSGDCHAWFPESWDEDKILEAGTAIANSDAPLIDNYHKTGIYDGVAVRVLFVDGKVATVCPDLDQDIVEGVSVV